MSHCSACSSPAALPQASWEPLTITCSHTRGCRVSPGPAWCPLWPRAEQKAKKVLKKLQNKTGPTPNVGTVASRARIKNRDIWIYCTGERQPCSVHVGPALYTLSTRSCATSDTLRKKKKKKINTTMCLQNNNCCSSRSCRLSPGCQGVSQPGLDVWSEQGGAAVPWDAPVVSWGGCRGGPGSPMAFEGLGGLGSSRCQGWELHSWHWLLHGSHC